MKLLTFHGPGHLLTAPGYFTDLPVGVPVEVDDHIARTLLIANPDLILSVEDIPEPAHAPRRRPKTTLTASPPGDAEPEANTGEGHTTDEKENH